MTIALGATFPLAIAMTSAAGEAAAAAAVIYATNTAGAIAGALAGSFILIPQLGLQRSLQLASIAAVLAGLFVAWRSAAGLTGPKAGLRYRLAASIAATSVVAFALLMPPWNHARLANGAYRFAPSLAAGDIETALEAGDLSYYREGAAGTVSVRQLIGVTSLAIDGKVDASNGSDMADAEAARALAIAAPRRSSRRVHHRPRQRRHAGRRPSASGRARGRVGDFTRSGRGVQPVREGEPRRPPRPACAADRRRWALSPAAVWRSVRRDHFRAVQSLDVRCLDALHARILRRGTQPARAGWHPLPMGAHV